MTSEVPPVYYNNDTHSFGFSTARSRWPKIIITAIEDVKLEISNNSSSNSSKSIQGSKIVSALENLEKSLLNNEIIKPFNKHNIPCLDSYDETLLKFSKENDGKPIDWLTGPWLFIECYLYRYIDAEIKSQSEWLNFDIFERLKRETFQSSSLGIYELAIRYKQLNEEINSKGASNIDNDTLKLLFEEFIDISLWGNATDLSLLANASLEDIKSVQGKEARLKSAKNILCNDLPEAWNHLLSIEDIKKRRVDFVLDNAGFEFYTDLILSLFLLDSNLVNEVVFHCKTRPWMVSDTMVKDYQLFIEYMTDKSFFKEHHEELNFVIEKIEEYRKLNKFKLVDSEFWTCDLDYWNINKNETKYGGAELYNYFQDSSLVIVKGDLNYRKLTGDRHWPRDTPFKSAIDGLSSSNINILALRTCKADVCAGLPKGKDEELIEYWKSLGNEIGELWCSSGKWAVISFSNGKN